MSRSAISTTTRFTAAVPIYLLGFFVTNIGVGGFTLAVGLALYRQTGSAATFGFLVAVEYALGFIGQAVGASVLDQRDTLTVALWVALARGVAVLVGGFVLVLSGTLGPLIVVFLISAFIRPIYRSASFVIVRQVCPVEALPRVNALRFGLLQAAQLTGLGIVAGLFAVVAPGTVICVVAGFLLAGAATLSMLRPRQVAVAEEVPAGSESRVSFGENWRQLGWALRSSGSLRLHLVLGGMPPVIASLASVLVAPVNQHVHGGSAGIAVLDGGAAVGALVTVLAVRFISAIRPDAVGVACAVALAGLGLLAASKVLAVAGTAFVLMGVAAALGATTLDTLMQRRADPRILGRLSISQECAISLSAVLMIPLYGPVANHWGIGRAVLLYAGIALLYLLLFAAGVLRYGDRLFGERIDAADSRRSQPQVNSQQVFAIDQEVQ